MNQTKQTRGIRKIQIQIRIRIERIRVTATRTRNGDDLKHALNNRQIVFSEHSTIWKGMKKIEQHNIVFRQNGQIKRTDTTKKEMKNGLDHGIEDSGQFPAKPKKNYVHKKRKELHIATLNVQGYSGKQRC